MLARLLDEEQPAVHNVRLYVFMAVTKNTKAAYYFTLSAREQKPRKRPHM